MANTIKNDMSNNQEVMDSIVGKTIGEFSDDKLRRVGKDAFRGCGSLSSVELPKVRSISDRAFKDCDSLEDITVGLDYDGITALGDDVFDGCENVNVLVPSEKVDLYRNSKFWSDFVKREDGVILNGPGSKGSICGLKDSLTVNWGRCGGEEDVIVTYNANEGIWIPSAFLTQGINYDSDQPKPDQLWLDEGHTIKDTRVGYKTWFGRSNYSWGGYSPMSIERLPCDSNSYYLYIAVYKLPQELGKWLYENAESNLGQYRDYNDKSGTTTQKDYNYKSIAIYPDIVSSWRNSNKWFVDIRKKWDIPYLGQEGRPMKPTENQQGYDYSVIRYLDEWEALEDDAYYLVAEDRIITKDNDEYLAGQLRLFNIDDTGTDHIWLRRYNTMTSYPSPKNKGKRYTFDTFLKPYSLPLQVNWGKCGGTEDVIVNYDKSEGLWIPKAFLKQGINYDSNQPKPDQLYLGDGVTKDTSVGYKTWFGEMEFGGTPRSLAGDHYIAVYKLPQELGRWLYENAETNLGQHKDYSTETSGGSAQDWNYKGIAIYPDGVSWWPNSDKWEVGIRKKSDIPIIGLDPETKEPTTVNYNGDFLAICNFDEWKALEDDAYYLVAECDRTYRNAHSYLSGHLGLFDIDDTGTDHIWLRRYNTMTSAPNDTNKGEKYSVPMALLPPNAKPLGGNIFYIDPNDNGATYTFYDEIGKEVKGTTLFELTSAKYYVKKGESTSDKVYVYYQTSYNGLQWWNNTTTTTGANGTAIGTGKTNTATVMSRADVPTDSIWSKLSEVRASDIYDDWFIPSKDEIYKFREADLEFWCRGGGFNPWSSSEYNGTSTKFWDCSYITWRDGSKTLQNAVFFARSF